MRNNSVNIENTDNNEDSFCLFMLVAVICLKFYSVIIVILLYLCLDGFLCAVLNFSIS